MADISTTNVALAFIYFGFFLGLFFNALSPQYYPTGTPIPKAPVCDLLTNISRLCIPSIAIPWWGGTLTLNVDIIVITVTFGSLLIGTYILEKNQRRLAYA